MRQLRTGHDGAAARTARSGKKRHLRRPMLVGLGAILATGTSMLAGVVPSGATSEPSGTINLVAYSTPEPAYSALIQAFNQTPQGKNVTVLQSYGASGSQAKAVLAGQPADVVNFSTATDMETLVAKGLVSSNWDSNPVTKGMVTDSVVVFVVPKGNPKHIETWADLLKPGIRIFTPNPFSSGSARWNIMAAYGAELKVKKTPAQAQAFVQQLLAKTVVQGTSASVEFQDFFADKGANKGDVFLDYEDDAIQVEQDNGGVSYVIPKQTILIENPIAVTTNSSNPTAAKAFVTYLESAAAQKKWAKLGYRPVLPAVASATRKSFPHPAQLFTIESLGGWDQVGNQFFGTTKGSLGIITQIEANLGQTT
jgi:sulfate/thiosulfate transport system substrate-binding protein